MKRKRNRRNDPPLSGSRLPDNRGEGEQGKQTDCRQMKSRRRRRRAAGRMMVSAAVLSGVFAAGACVLYLGLPAPIQARLDILPDKHAREGTLYEQENRQVEEGNFWVVVNQLPTVEEGAGECNIEYENPAGNHYSARISLYLEETGKLLGNTTRVDPGYYVETISLKQKLTPGEYPVTARIELFDYRTPAGEMSIGITLRVTKHQDNQTSKEQISKEQTLKEQTAEYRETDNKTDSKTDSKTDNKTGSITDGKTDNKTDHKTETGREKQKGETG